MREHTQVLVVCLQTHHHRASCLCELQFTCTQLCYFLSQVWALLEVGCKLESIAIMLLIIVLNQVSQVPACYCTTHLYHFRT